MQFKVIVNRHAIDQSSRTLKPLPTSFTPQLSSLGCCELHHPNKVRLLHIKELRCADPYLVQQIGPFVIDNTEKACYMNEDALTEQC